MSEAEFQQQRRALMDQLVAIADRPSPGLSPDEEGLADIRRISLALTALYRDANRGRCVCLTST